MSTPNDDPNWLQRCREFCRDVENAAYYMHGLIDALESIDDKRFAGPIHHLRIHAHTLSYGMLYLIHGYQESHQGTGH